MRITAESSPPALLVHPRLPSWRWRWIAALFLVLVLGAASTSLWLAQQNLNRGLADLRGAVATLHAPTTLRDPVTRTALHDRLIRAHQSFGQARTLLGPWSIVLSHVGWVPILGPRLAAAGPASDAAYHTTGAAIALSDGLDPVLAAIGHPSSHTPLLRRVTPILARSHPQFERARADASLASADLARIPSTGGDAALAAATTRLRRNLPILTGTATWLALAPAVLGANTPSRFLFAWEDPMELRAAGGFIGASDVITLNGGAIAHRFSGRVPVGREMDTVFMPTPEAVYTPESYWVFCDSNWSPHFPLSARLERWFYGEDTGIWTDGVIDFVDSGIAGILQATGPIYVPAYHQWVNAANVTTLAQHYINGAYKGPDAQGEQDAVRKQFFRHVMAALQQRIEVLPLKSWITLGGAISAAIAHHDILIYDRRPDVQAAIQRAGADGAVRTPPGDYLYVVDDNRSYNKLNPFVQEEIGHSTAIAPDGWLDDTVSIRYHVRPSPPDLQGFGPDLGPLSQQDGYGPGLAPIGSKHDYADFLRVYVPSGSVLTSISGLDAWSPQNAYGHTQFAGMLFVPQNGSATVTIRYRAPPTVLGTDPRAYHLTVQRQPGSSATLRLSVLGTDGVRVLGVAPPLSLQRDVTVHLPISGVRPLHSVPLAPTPQFADPYIPYSSFHDPKHPL